MSTLTFVFWFSGLFIFYSFLGYPIFLKIISFFIPSRRPIPSRNPEARVTLLISAYNEEADIEDKIHNSLTLTYPRRLLEIIVVSDGSTDSTCNIVSRYTHRGVKLLHYEGRIGKTACLNQAVRRAEGEIIVFSDANSHYHKGTVRELVKHFADERIGFVTGRTIHVSGGVGGVSGSIGLYSTMEQWVKILESKIGACIGADGAVFAIRKALYQPLNSFDINDLVIPLNVVKQGYLGKLENNAFCFENTSSAPGDEFHRQVRITNRTIRAIFNHASLLNPLQFGILSFELFSHKVARLFVPFLLFTLFITNLCLAIEEPVYLLLFIGQLLFYIIARCNYSGLNWVARLLSLPHTFSLVNLAILYGWIQYFKGETFVTWTPSRR